MPVVINSAAGRDPVKVTPQDGSIRFGQIKRPDFRREAPSHVDMFTRRWFSRRQGTNIRQEPDRKITVIMHAGLETLSNDDGYFQLLGDFPTERRRPRLTGLDLSAGKLPLQTLRLGGRALGNEEPPIPLYECARHIDRFDHPGEV